MSAEPGTHRGELHHGEQILRQLFVTAGDAAEVLKFGEEPLDQIAFAV